MGLFNTIRMGASGAEPSYTIDRSLRFSGVDQTRLNFTPSSDGNRKKWTWAAWIKRGSIDRRYFWSAYTSGPNVTSLQFQDNGNLNFEDWLSGYRFHLRTAGLYRDPSTWFHLVVYVDTAQSTASDRVKMYVNGVEPEFEATVYPTQNLDTKFNTGGLLHAIGTEGTNQRLWFDGYMADVYFLDGYAYDPSYFGETDATTGQWIPKKYEGSFGTNGYYLNFSDNSSTSALGTDSSGQGNNNTPVNFSVTAGSGNDSLEDTPTNNFPTLNPLAPFGTTAPSLSNGNLDFNMTTNNMYPMSTFTIPKSGKWYVEIVFTAFGNGGVIQVSNPVIQQNSSGANRHNGINYYSSQINVDNSSVQTGVTTLAVNNIIGICVDRDAGTVLLKSNNSDVGSAVNISSFSDATDLVFAVGRNSGHGSDVSGNFNFGQRPFNYTPPTGFKALCSANLPNPTILLPNNHFDTVLYSGDSNNNTEITVGFQPDLVWIKNRTEGSSDGVGQHMLFDSMRIDPSNSRYQYMGVNNTDADATNANGLQALTSTGFKPGSMTRTNETGDNYVSWNWNAGGSTVTNNSGSISSQVRTNATAGFSIVTYSGNGTDGATVGHGLGVAPDCIITKSRNLGTLGTAGAHWSVAHKGLTNGMNGGSNARKLHLSLDQAESTTNHHGLISASSSTTFTLKTGTSNDTDAHVNDSSGNYVAYCFSEVAGYSKFGLYTGNGNADGAFVYTGFRPAFIIIKNRGSTTEWRIYDDDLTGGINPINKIFYTNLNYAETTTGHPVDFVSNGVKMRGTFGEMNSSGDQFVYLAFAESPFKYSRAR